jgi:WhiB family redox-sensing transcriptional regulator
VNPFTAALMVPENFDFPGTIEEVMNRPAWHRWAACSGQGTGSFIVGLGGNYNRARELCAACSVQTECLTAALADPELLGMWGGTTERERVQMRAGRGVA